MFATFIPARIPHVTGWSAFSVEKKEDEELLALWADTVIALTKQAIVNKIFFIV